MNRNAEFRLALLARAAFSQMALSSHAAAQERPSATDAAPAQVEEVAVTGSQIRGVAPVGSSLIGLNRDDFSRVPALTTTDLMRAACLTAVATIFAFAPQGAVAQVTDAANASPSAVKGDTDPSRIAEIIVTAERRDISIQRLPISISALNDKDLEAKAVTSVADLQRLVPALSITDTGLQRFVNIRGIGQSASLPQIQSGISYHVDGVYTRNVLTEVPYYDIERVEVLRGPQGTLSGQSSTGGAIFVVTRLPRLDEAGGHAELSYGNYDHFSGEGAINVPISEKVALRAAIYGENRDSFYEIISPPGNQSSTSPTFHPGNLSRIAGRVSLLVKPVDDLQIILRGEYYDRRSDGYAFKPTPGDPTATFNSIAASSVTPSDRWTLDYNVPGKSDLNLKRVSAEVKWDFSPSLQLRSLSSYLRAKINGAFDQDGTGTLQTTGTAPRIRDLAAFQTIELAGTSQEFNLITTGSGPLQAVAGVYYFNARNAPSALTNAAIDTYTDKSHVVSKAVFGQVTYDFGDFQIVGGLRYNIDRAYQNGGYLTIRAIGLTSPIAPTDNTSRALTGKVSINYNISPDHLLYATAARGYKAGSYNSSGLPSYEPEHVWSYEAGLKSKLFDRHLQIQLAAFDSEYTGFQVNAFDPAINAQYVQNAGNARIYGVEAQAQAAFGGLSIDGSVALSRSKFGDSGNGSLIAITDTRHAVGDVNRGPIIITGRRLPFAQNVTATVGAQYRFELGSGTLTPRVQYSYNGSQWATIFQKSYDYIPSRDTVDLRLTYATDDWSLAGFVTNVGNITYIAGKFGGDDYYGPPREYGIKFSYNF